MKEDIDFIDRNDINEYISRLTQEADMEKEQAAIEEEAKEEKLGREIKIDIDF